MYFLPFAWVEITMARRAGAEHLDSSDEWIAEGSDDDLGMDPSYSYDSDSSGEGIILQ